MLSLVCFTGTRLCTSPVELRGYIDFLAGFFDRAWERIPNGRTPITQVFVFKSHSALKRMNSLELITDSGPGAG